MSDLRDLYQDLILDHHKRPRNRHKMAHPTNTAEGYNPLCGDRVTVYVKVDQGKVADISFEGSGCAISTAAASLMTQYLKGKSVEEAEKTFEDFHRMITSSDEDAEAVERLGKLAVLQGVREFPTRVKCATLAWHTLHSALTGNQETVSTE